MITPPARKVLTIIDPTTGTAVNTVLPKEEKIFEFVKTKPVKFTDPAIRDREAREQKEREEEAARQEQLAVEKEAQLEKKRQEERRAQEEQESRRVINELEAERKKHKVFKRIDDVSVIQYPTGIVSPIQDDRKHVYSIDFLLQHRIYQMCLKKKLNRLDKMMCIGRFRWVSLIWVAH
jgi:hypothetical protein